MTKAAAKRIALKVAVTFLESFIGYLAVAPNILSKAAIAGAVGAGLSATYNLARHYLDV
jgi:hypothetical protein